MKAIKQKLLLHPSTVLQVELALAQPPQGIMLVGPAGNGKSALALALAAELLEIKEDKTLDDNPFFYLVQRQKNKQDIAIEQIREVISNLKLKATGQNRVQRIVFIEDAQYMSLPAQNALLKILEEPPSGAVFLLSAPSSQKVLPTIASRVQTLDVRTVSLQDSLAFWESKHQRSDIESAWRLSGGSAGLMYALLNEDKNHPLKDAVTQARRFLSSKKYDRLIIIDKLSQNKESLEYFIDGLSRILNFLHHSAVEKQKQNQAKAILQSRKQLQEVQKALAANANLKLLTIDFVLNIKI